MLNNRTDNVQTPSVMQSARDPQKYEARYNRRAYTPLDTPVM